MFNQCVPILMLPFFLTVSACTHESGMLKIARQGSFMAGGKMMTATGEFDAETPFQPDGQTFHGDHAYVFYQIPENPHALPLVFLHGAGQSAKTWETTPDGREGFQNLFLRRNYGVYLVDQPRRGKAGRSMKAAAMAPVPDEQMWFSQFRMGVWPELFPGSRFPKGEEALNQFFRQMTPNTGDFDLEVISDSLAAVYEKIGPGILVTHSQGGGPGWLAAMKSNRIKAVIAYEPGSNFTFPQGEVPPPEGSAGASVEALGVSRDEFMKLTRIPIVIYYGDYIPELPGNLPGVDYWRACMKMAEKWVEVIKRHGGEATIIHLPKTGIRGNTHFPFADENNREVANLLATWLKEKGL